MMLVTSKPDVLALCASTALSKLRDPSDRRFPPVLYFIFIFYTSPHTCLATRGSASPQNIWPLQSDAMSMHMLS
jgi:hypothetical protein